MAKTLKQKVAERLDELGRNPFEAARSVDLERGFINDLLQDKKRTVKGENLKKLAQALDWTIADLVEEAMGGGPSAAPKRPVPVTGSDVELPIRCEVAAGSWQAIDEASDEVLGYAPAPTIPGYERFPQWYERVLGESFNRKIPNGALIHVVDAIAMGYAPKQDDVVVVMRRRAGGAFFERSVKQVELTPNGILLWPRSFDPKWSKPLDLAHGLKEGEDATVEIVGKVLRAYIGLEG
jgi:hypothetical protein